MSENDVNDASSAFEKASQDAENSKYVLRLYVAGNTQKSSNAIQNLRKICDEYLHGRYKLEVIDIYQQPEEARSAQVIATPTLIKYLPLPFRRIIGDLSQTDRILVGLNIEKIDE